MVDYFTYLPGDVPRLRPKFPNFDTVQNLRHASMRCALSVGITSNLVGPFFVNYESLAHGLGTVRKDLLSCPKVYLAKRSKLW